MQTPNSIKENDRSDFRLSFVNSSTGKSEIKLENAPAFVIPLEMDPSAKEARLSVGKWCILCFGVWSNTDRANIITAINVLAKRKGEVVLGLRPFYNYDEIRSWFPKYNGDPATPLWVILENGKVKASRSGRLTSDDLEKLIEVFWHEK